MRKKVVIAYPVKVEITPNEIVIFFPEGVIGVQASSDVLQPMVDKAETILEETNSPHLSVEEIKHVKEKTIN